MKFVIAGKEVEIPNDDLTTAIENNTETFDLSLGDGVVVRTEEEENTFKENMRLTGFSDGTEVGRKEILKGLGLEPNGAHKNDAKTIEALNNFVNGKVKTALSDANIEPSKKLEAAQRDIETLQGTITTMTNDYTELEGKFGTFKKTQAIKTTLGSLIPDNTVIPKQDMLTLIGTKIKADVDDTGFVFALGMDGNPIKDSKTLAVKPLKDVVNGFFSENPQYLTKASGGAGGDDSTSGSGEKKQTVDSFIEEMGEKNILPSSEAFNTEMMKRQKAGTLDV